MKRILALVLCVLMVVGLFAACGSNNGANTSATPTAQNSESAAPDQSAEPTEVAKGGDIITACLAEEPKTIDPTLNASVDGASYDVHLFEGLTTVDKDLQIVPGMASDWTISPDGTVYTFKLRDAVWSDGKPVTANDFVFAWRRATDPNTAAEYAYQMYYLKNAAAINGGSGAVDTLGVKAIDDKTLEVTLEAPCAYFINLTGFPTYFPLREDVVSPDPQGWSTKAETFVSNGPYKLASWEHDSMITLEKNANYWNASAILPSQIVFVLMADATTILSSFKNGEIMYADIVPRDELESLKTEGSLKIDPLLGVRYVNFNTQKKPFDDVKVRKALSLVIDRQYIANTVIGGGEMAADGFVPGAIPDAIAGPDFRTKGGSFYSIKTEDYEANVAEAKKLLAEAGFPDGKGFPTFSYMTNDADPNVRIAEAIQQMFKEHLGLTMEVSVQEWGVFQESRKNGEYDVCRGGWLGDYVDPMTFLDLFITTSDLNDPDFTNPEFDAIIDQAKKETDTAKRFELMHQAEKILMDNTPIAPFSFYTEPQLISQNLEGFVHSPLGFKYFMWSTVKQ